MAEVPFTQKRANPRFSFFADAEMTLKDETLVRTQLVELSSRGCYLGTLEPIPIGTEFRLRISDGIRTCELQGKVIYLHSSNGLGIFGIGVLFGRMSAEHRSVIDAWLNELAGEHADGEDGLHGPGRRRRTRTQPDRGAGQGGPTKRAGKGETAWPAA
jgi:PilZ domain